MTTISLSADTSAMLSGGAGTTATFTASVGGTSPTGSVTFLDGTTTLGTQALIGGVATLTTSELKSGGTHTVTAHYNGDTNNAALTSENVIITVTAASAASASSASIGSVTLSRVVYPTPFVYTVLAADAASTWTIVHNLHGYPIVDVYVDYTGTPVKIIPASVTYTDQNTVTLTFSSPHSGYATVV